jgi:hypothetical protein
MTREEKSHMTDKDQIFFDSRTIVRESASRASEPKRTVAMNCIRELERDEKSVSAVLPMLLETYLQPNAAELIQLHERQCGLRRPIMRAVIAGSGVGGVMGAVVGWFVRGVLGLGA